MAAHQASPSLGFSRQEHWSGLPFPSPTCESEIAQSCPTLATPWTAAYQAPPSMGFSRQKYWSGVPEAVLKMCKHGSKRIRPVWAWGTETINNMSCCCCCYWVASVMSDSVRPHRQQPTRFPRAWDSPGKNTGVGCHFLLQCMKVKSESEVTQSCPTLSDSMDCSLPGSSVHEIFQARVLE